MGGDQEVPRGVTRVRVHKSVNIIPRDAFRDCYHLVSIEMHDGVEIIEEGAFNYWNDCSSLKRLKLPGVRVIGHSAFCGCTALETVEFGDKLETIVYSAFSFTSLRNIKLPKVRVVRDYAFANCKQLTEAEFSEDLERIGGCAFGNCPRLRRIAIPLKDGILDEGVFARCGDLSQVDLVGGIHKTISTLLLERWRNEINNEIDLINRHLPTTPADEKTTFIRWQMERVMRRIDHYKSEHYALLKDAMTLLELALWKAKLPKYGDEELSVLCALLNAKLTMRQLAHWKAKSDEEFMAIREKAHVTCGANIIIPHVLSFLNDDHVFPLLNQST
jgi:hypothetical protein